MNLKELSEYLGLSQTTVSRAINGYPEVNEKTRARVQAAAREHNYRPSTVAQNLATGKANAIGHILPLSHQEIVNPIFTDFIAGAGEVYSANGYHMVLSVVSDREEQKAYRDMATRRIVDGVIVHGPRRNDPRIKLLQDIGLPFLVHGRTEDDNPEHCWMDVNNFGAFKRATDFLLDFGHRRIALLNGDERMGFAIRRRDGYEAALRAKNVTPDPRLMRSSDMTERYGYIEAREMLSQPDAPTAFLVSSTIVAMGIERYLIEQQLELGRDISVVTYDDQISYLHVGSDVPRFTSTRSSIREAGKRCAQMLIEMIADPDQIGHELWEAELTLGSSTGPVPA